MKTRNTGVCDGVRMKEKSNNSVGVKSFGGSDKHEGCCRKLTADMCRN